MNAFKTAAAVAALFILTACGNSNDYSLLNPPAADNTAQMIKSQDDAARAKEQAMLEQYERMDYKFFSGDAEAYK